MPVQQVEVFISYAHADEALRKELEKHLSLLQQRQLITGWHDRLIPAGVEWADEIDAHLNSAQIILLLISADFLASRYCYSIEMKRALERQEAGEARVIPIILRPVDWEQEPSLNKLQALPTNAKAVTTWSTHPTYDEAFKDIARGIRTVVEVYAKDPILPTANRMQVWNVLYRRNPYFTGQESILTKLHTTFTNNKAVALTQPLAISGLGGIGKTQIALEYAYQHEHAYHAILWVQADTRDSFISSFCKLADFLQLSERDAQDQQLAVEAVKRWLEMHQQWLLILDNADDLTLLDEFLPRRDTGHILLTTRAQAMGTIAHCIEVEPMDASEGALLLLRRAKVLAPNAPLEQASAADRAAAHEIVQELGGLPLALDQAAAYIDETRCGLSGYLGRYRAERTTLLQRRGTWVKDHPEPVTTTWSLSFAHVQAANATAADLLQLCAFLHPDAIPEEMLSEEAPQFVPSLRILADHATTFDDAIASLRAYSLIRRNPETKTLSLHRLVQAVLRDNLDTKQQCQWAAWAIYTVNQLFPSVEFANWPVCERYLSHAQASVALIDTWNISFPEAARLLNQAGWYLRERGRYAEAEPLIKCALAIYEQQSGKDYTDTAISLNNLALLYKAQGKYAEAEPLVKRALAIREQESGKDHPNTAASLNNLAGLYHDQGKFAEAEQLYQRALAIREQQLGKDHPNTATSLNNLALLYQAQKKYAEAEPLFKRALAICEQQLGKDHPNTASSLNNLALLYRAQGRYTEAEPLFKRALAIREQQLGKDHPNTASSLDNLAGLYHDQGKYAKAKPLYQRALTIYEQKLGKDHPSTATIRQSYTLLQQDMQRHR